MIEIFDETRKKMKADGDLIVVDTKPRLHQRHSVEHPPRRQTRAFRVAQGQRLNRVGSGGGVGKETPDGGEVGAPIAERQVAKVNEPGEDARV